MSRSKFRIAFTMYVLLIFSISIYMWLEPGHHHTTLVRIDAVIIMIAAACSLVAEWRSK